MSDVMTEPTVNLDELRAACEISKSQITRGSECTLEHMSIAQQNARRMILNAAPALIAELAAARAEIERLRGFEPCHRELGVFEKFGLRRDHCGVLRREHDRRMAYDKSQQRATHEFVSGAFDAEATTEGK